MSGSRLLTVPLRSTSRFVFWVRSSTCELLALSRGSSGAIDGRRRCFVRSESGAKADAGEQHSGTLKPCPDRCALKSSEFSAEGIPGSTSGAAATRQIKGGLTVQEYSVVFTKGSVVGQVYANAELKDAAGLKETVVTAAQSLYATLP